MPHSGGFTAKLYNVKCMILNFIFVYFPCNCIIQKKFPSNYLHNLFYYIQVFRLHIATFFTELQVLKICTMFYDLIFF